MKKLLLLLLLCLCTIPRAAAYTIYYDNSSTNANPPYVYLWDSTSNNGIKSMTKVDGKDNLYYYTWDKTPIGVIFLKGSDWGTNGANKLTGDVTSNIADGSVYSGGKYLGSYDDVYNNGGGGGGDVVTEKKVWRLHGQFTSSSWASTVFDEAGSNKFTCELTVTVAEGAFGMEYGTLKGSNFSQDSWWNVSNQPTLTTSSPVTLRSGNGGSDAKYSLTKGTTYIFTFDASTHVLSVAEKGADDSRLVWYTPDDATMYDEITLYYNANAGNAPFADNKGSKDIYIYPGADTNIRPDDQVGWMYSKWTNDNEFPESCKMTYDSKTDLYQISFTPIDFFDVRVANSNVYIDKLYSQFRMKDDSSVGGDADGNAVETDFGPEIIEMSGDRTVYFKSPWGSNPVRAYVYYGESPNATEILGAWPGATMALIQDDWYTITVPGNNIPADITPLIILSADDTTNRYPADQQGGVKLSFTGEGWTTLADFKNGVWYPENPEGPFVSGYTGYTFDGTTVTVETKNKTIYITPYTTEIIKIFTLPPTPAYGFETKERESISVLPDLAPVSGIITKSSIDDSDDDYLIINIKDTKMYVSKLNGDIRFEDGEGNVMLRESGGLNNTVAGNRSLSFAGMSEYGLYGGGYFGTFNQNGKSITMTNTQTGSWPEQGGYNHNICIPFYVSTNGYGVFIDDHYIGATLSPSSNGSRYSTRSENPIAYYYIGGGSMARVLENYTYLTGRQPMPPYWALGYITSRYGYVSRSQAESAINRIKDPNEGNLPLDAIVLDIYWQGRSGVDPIYMGKLDWDSNAFPNATEMMKNWKDRNINTILITEPYFTSQVAGSNYNELNSKGYFADTHVSGNNNMSWVGKGNSVGLLDVTNQGAIDWMSEKYAKHTKSGVASWWLDLGEPEAHDDDSQYVKGNKNQVHNEYGQRWLELAYNATKKAFEESNPSNNGERFILMPRSATAGMQRFSPFPWTGDISRSWAGLTVQVPALLSLGMSGVGYLGSDVGGFIHSGYKDSDMYRRWIQSAVFAPAMRTHSQVPESYEDPNALSDSGPEPYNYTEVLDNVRDMINKRYKFIPYTYTLAYENSTKGWPLARPTNFYTPYDSELMDDRYSDQYLWGKDLLVAPVVRQGQNSKEIIFPEGRWIDMNDFSHEIYGDHSATHRITYNTSDQDKLPHFARMGSFIPCYTQDTFTSTAEIDRSKMTILYFHDDESSEPATSYFYDDDHKSPTAIADGNYCITRLSYGTQEDSNWVTITYDGKPDEILPEEMTYTISIPAYKGVVGMQGLCVLRRSTPSARSGRATTTTKEMVTLHSDKSNFDAAEENVAYRDNDGTVHIKAKRRKGDTMVQAYFNETTTAIDDIESAARRLSIAARGGADDLTLRYFVPVDGVSADITLHSASGMTVAAMSGLEAAEGEHFAAIGAVTPGVYVAHINVTTANGSSMKTTAKIIVR